MATATKAPTTERAPTPRLLEKAAHDPATAAALAAVLVGLPAAAALNARFGGFAGPLTPQQAAEKLAAGEAFLVDLRSDEGRARDGVLDLRFKARGRAAALPVSRGAALSQPVVRAKGSGGVRSVRVLEDATLATLAASLAAARAAADGNRGRGALKRLPVIFLDSGAGGCTDAVRVARAAASPSASSPTTRLGKPYVLDGGFAAWSRAGLGVKGGSSYDSSPADALADAAAGLLLGSGGGGGGNPSKGAKRRAEAEAAVAVATGGDTAFARVVAETSPLSPGSLKRAAASPFALAGAAGAASLVAAAALHWRESLEFLGALGLLVTASRKLLAYDSPADLAADAGSLLRAAKGAVGGGAPSSGSKRSVASAAVAALEAEREREAAAAAAGEE